MIYINLLPFRSIRRKDEARDQFVVFLLIMVVVCFAVAWYHLSLNRKIEDLEMRIEVAKKDTEKYNKIAEEVEILKQNLALLKNKLEVINELDMDRESAYQLMTTLINLVIPERMWITRLDSTQEKIRKEPELKKRGKAKAEPEKPETPEKPPRPNVNIGVTGIALDNKTVADFMKRLQEDKLFKNVQLVKVEKYEINQGKDRDPIFLKSFEIKGQQVPPEPVTEEQPKDTPKPEEKKVP